MVKEIEQALISMFSAVGFTVTVLGTILALSGHIKIIDFAGKIALIIN